MIIQVCRADGVVIGKFEETAFQEKLRRGEFPVASGQYSYWHDGMADWKPLSEYHPPGKITKILQEMQSKRQRLKSSSSSRNPPNSRESVLKKITRAFLGKDSDR